MGDHSETLEAAGMGSDSNGHEEYALAVAIGVSKSSKGSYPGQR